MKKAFSPAITMLAVAAGFVGGIASQWLLPTRLVHAQVQSPHRMVAQQFVLVDPKGVTRGEFKIEGEQPQIILYHCCPAKLFPRRANLIKSMWWE